MISYDALVETKWTYNNKSHFERKGYQFTRFRDQIKVKVYDLLPQSNVKVPVICDFCGIAYNLEFCTANKNEQQVCKNCHGKKIRKVLGYSYETIKKTLEEKGFLLLTSEEEYLSKNTMNCKLLMLCPNNHLNSTTFNNWLKGKDSSSGYRCSKCNLPIPTSIDELKKAFESECYILNCKEYINSTTKMDYTCPNGYNWAITWNEWQNGNRCPCKKCSGRNPKYTIEEIKSIVEPLGRTVLSTDYKADGKKAGVIELFCPIHGPYKNRLDTILSKLESSLGCKECGIDEMIKSQKARNYISAPQLYLNYLLGGNEHSIEKLFETRKIDIVLPNIWNLHYKGFIEYDGGGHFRAVYRKKNPLTYSDIVLRDNLKRNKYFENSWKGIIIRSKTDKFPSDSKIIDSIKLAIDILNHSKHYFVTIDIDQGVMLYGAKNVSKVINGKPVYMGRYRRKLHLGELKKVNKEFTDDLFKLWIKDKRIT